MTRLGPITLAREREREKESALGWFMGERGSNEMEEREAMIYYVDIPSLSTGCGSRRRKVRTASVPKPTTRGGKRRLTSKCLWAEYLGRKVHTDEALRKIFLADMDGHLLYLALELFLNTERAHSNV